MRTQAAFCSLQLIFAAVFVLCSGFLVIGCGSGSSSSRPMPPPAISPTPTPTPGPNVASDKTLRTEDVATGLDNPWSLAFAPDGRLFFTEPHGRLRVIETTGLVATPVLDISSQTPGFEAGLTGMDLDRGFATNGVIYIHYCPQQTDGL